MIHYPLPDCDVCKQTPGIMKKDGRWIECVCILKQRAQEYLTPAYATARYIKKLNVSKLEGKNILVDSDEPSSFKALVKSFLLNTGMQYPHITCTGHEVLQRYLRNKDERGFDELSTVPLLIFYLVLDPYSKRYGDMITSILENRKLKKLSTIMYSSFPIKSKTFLDRYTSLLSGFLQDNFTPMRTGK